MIRLNKYLAERGVCARRKADALIESGVVAVDGRVALLGESIDPTTQRVTINGRRIAHASQKSSTLVMNKPRGVVTTMHDERGRPCIAQLLPKSPRYFPVGRLDADSTGVLLCTTDGELARVLTHPSFGVEKIYRVRATGALTPQTIKALGARDLRRHPDGSHSFSMTLHEGRNRQVRRMCAGRGLRVIDLERIRFGPVTLAGLKAGKTREPTRNEHMEFDRLRSLASGSPETTLKPRKRAAVQPTE
ncbi:MAG TPA: pseudouridine synthase [Candidatus Eremiobacteraceae bacterium]|nr:pseudouridine synthase [Candidatus Eremiobacteraceae bacterium]